MTEDLTIKLTKGQRVRKNWNCTSTRVYKKQRDTRLKSYYRHMNKHKRVCFISTIFIIFRYVLNDF